MIRFQLILWITLGVVVIGLPMGTSAQTNGYDPLDEMLEKIKYDLETGSDLQRLAAVQQLSDLRTRRGMDMLLNALNDSHPMVRQKACYGLGLLNSYRPTRALIRVAEEDENIFVRQEAIRALGQIGNRSAIEPLKELLSEQIFFLMPHLEQTLLRLGVPSNEINRVEGLRPTTR